ncbi:MAG: SIR2 family protein [Anaerolineales bacterium]|nr:SIR2 family protein [Anaerolineales bacterium]
MSSIDNEQRIQDIIRKLKGKKLIPFVGAGMSKPLGLPDWDDLVEEVAVRTNQDPKAIREIRDLLVAIEYLFIKGAARAEDILAKIVDKDPVPESRTHECLAAFNAPEIYTTNWDNVIEGTYDRLGKPYNLVEKAADFLCIESFKPTIIKYHGSLHHPRTLVVTESDFYERFGTDSPFDIRLRSDLMEKSLLFLGYSLRDYNVRYLWNRVQKTLSAFINDPPPPSYFVSIHRDEVFETVLAKNNIVTINLDSEDKFLPFMEFVAENAQP